MHLMLSTMVSSKVEQRRQGKKTVAEVMVFTALNSCNNTMARSKEKRAHAISQLRLIYINPATLNHTPPQIKRRMSCFLGGRKGVMHVAASAMPAEEGRSKVFDVPLQNK